jgi:hypothetical protein
VPIEDEVEPVAVPDVPLDDVEGERCTVMAGLVVAVGKSCDRASLTRARAAKKLAAAAAMFWFEILTLSSSAFN